MTPCSATRKDGQPCTQAAQPGGAHCWGHRPDLVEKRRESSAKGGANKATAARLGKRMPTTLRPVLDVLYGALEGVKDGEIEPKQGTALATIATAIARIYEAAEVDSRLTALEAQVVQQRRRQGA
ncbi:MAG TPA: hypothetical protein VNL71_01385 [Chloroflexota bacterium]|nr:hypothetical protein [Chloroflexota bacterium]